MLIQVKVPSVGESIREGLLAEWLKQDGEWVALDDPLFVLETDKVTMPIHAESAGQLKILVAAGQIVKIGQAVGEIETAARPESGNQRAGKPGNKKETEKQGNRETGKEKTKIVAQTAGAAMHPPAGIPQVRAKLAAASLDDLSPSVRRMVSEYQIDPKAIPGSGRGGRVTKEDVVAFLGGKKEPESGRVGEPGRKIEPESRRAGEPELDRQAFEDRPSDSALDTQHLALSSRQVRTPLSPIRQRIAERLLLSQQTTATLTTFAEADMFEVLALREESKETFKARHGVGLGFMSFFVKAVVDALQAYPALRSRIEGGDLVRNDYYDIGIAVSTDRGLVVPVVRGADQKGFPDIERDIAVLAARARNKTITLPELEGAVFTITNAGSYGALFGTPILNPPQSGILGTYAIQERPMVRNAQIVARPMMYLSLSYDHRIVDGESAGRFLMRVAEDLEHPGRLMLEI